MSRSGHEVFRVSAGHSSSGLGAGELGTSVRALAGMQKEAIVASSSSAWRLFCDEGHYLDGTDLAPPPLSFFSAGMQFSVLWSILRAARARNLPLDALRLEQDTVYHIEGSFLRGDARGSAEAPAIALHVEVEGSEAEVRAAVEAGVNGAPALALARDVLANRFGLTLGGRRVPLDGMRSTDGGARRPDAFEAAKPRAVPDPAVISKLSDAERVENDPHGAGVGLRAEQRRTIHLRGRAAWTGESRFRSDVELVHPIGSSFRLRADAEGEKAPPPEAFLVAGVGFCTMTQLGRYASIQKRPLADYRLLQSNRFVVESGRAVARPFDTDVFLGDDWSDEEAADLVRVGERTCYLHATMRERLEPRVSIAWKGRALEP